MHFAYIDESGDSGVGGSRTYALGCVLVDGNDWPDRFDRLIDFRRHLRDLYGIPVRAEIKANHLLRNGGAFRPLRLSESARYGVYRQCMRLHPKLGFKTFAVVINKATAATSYPGRPVMTSPGSGCFSDSNASQPMAMKLFWLSTTRGTP